MIIIFFTNKLILYIIGWYADRNFLFFLELDCPPAGDP